MRYRKKPVVIEAIKWTGNNLEEIQNFALGFTKHDIEEGKETYLYIHTLEGHHKASIGDMIIKGIKGEFYPCKPDIFAATYEPVDSHQPYVSDFDRDAIKKEGGE